MVKPLLIDTFICDSDKVGNPQKVLHEYSACCGVIFLERVKLGKKALVIHPPQVVVNG